MYNGCRIMQTGKLLKYITHSKACFFRGGKYNNLNHGFVLKKKYSLKVYHYASFLNKQW